MYFTSRLSLELFIVAVTEKKALPVFIENFIGRLKDCLEVYQFIEAGASASSILF
jgi:hypothetical protein